MAVLLCEALDDLVVGLVVVGLLAHEEEDVRLDETLEYLLRSLMVELDDERYGVPVDGNIALLGRVLQRCLMHYMVKSQARSNCLGLK